MPQPVHTVTRESIIGFIRANEYRSNPRSQVFGGGRGSSCRYAEPDGTPSCVIGHVLADAGFEPPALSNVYAPLLFSDLNLPDAVGGLVGDIQGYADHGYTWGTALRLALIERGETL